MILNERVETTIVATNSKYYAALGYGSFAQLTRIDVDLKDLPLKSMARVNVSCDKCKRVWETHYQKVSRKSNHWCLQCTRTMQYQKMDHTSRKRAAMQSMLGERNHNWNPKKTEFAKYRSQVHKFTTESYNTFKDQINPDNLPRTLCGVENGYQLDHKISIKYGFDNSISPEVIGSVKNLQMLSWEINRSKYIHVDDAIIDQILEGA